MRKSEELTVNQLNSRYKIAYDRAVQLRGTNKLCPACLSPLHAFVRGEDDLIFECGSILTPDSMIHGTGLCQELAKERPIDINNYDLHGYRLEDFK